MDIFKEIEKLTDSDTVELAQSFKDEINKKLVLGHSRHVVRYGVLSDGHECITDAQKYFQAIREMWGYSNSIKQEKVRAMRAHADLIDAQEAQKKAKKRSEKIRAEADLLEAHTALTNALVYINDLSRQLDEFNKVRQELEASVMAKYPGGVEQAELDNWKAVYDYRMIKDRASGHSERVDNIPLPAEVKAELGYYTGRFDAIAPLNVADKSKANKIALAVDKEIARRKQKALPQKSQ